MSLQSDHAARVVAFRLPSNQFMVGQDVYLSQEYYNDANTGVLEVPRYGWQVKSVEDGVATIEYQRPNLKLLMTLTVETRYLRQEV